MKDNSDFAIRMKNYESFETERKFIPLLPVYCRLDGRGFSKFTKGMDRPFDIRMINAMTETTKFLVKETNAKIGYTQSDEISLVWKASDYKNGIFFNGKIHKMTSVLASLATAAFTKTILNPKIGLQDYVSRMPHFDCRVISFPNDIEATNMFLWRAQDATKNAISMAAQHYYSHKELQNKKGFEMQEMLFQKNINFNDYPTYFKQGTFIRKEIEEKNLSEEEKQKWQKFGFDDDSKSYRHIIKEIEMPIFSKVSNRIDVIFNGAIPLTGAV